jgi:DNA-binding PadR family transcriptional regulator
MRLQERGPPLKLYKLTEKGRAALDETKTHYQAVANALHKKPKMGREKGKLKRQREGG